MEKENILTLPGFCGPFGLFHIFLEGRRFEVVAFYRLKAGQNCFKRPERQAVFLLRFRSPARFSPVMQRKMIHYTVLD